MTGVKCASSTDTIDDYRASDIDLPLEDVRVVSDRTILGGIDLLVQKCKRYLNTQCVSAPLEWLIFTAVAPVEVTGGVWDFGDGSPPQTGLVVQHQYSTAGQFDVSFTVGYQGGTVSVIKRRLISILAGQPGDPCQSDQACDLGPCVCKKDCPFPLDNGLCLQICTLSSCPQGFECADLSRGLETSIAAWQTQTCLPRCQADEDCTRTGFACRRTPSLNGWINSNS